MSEERLICGIFVAEDTGGMLLSFSRLVIVNSDGSGHKFLSRSLGSRALGISQDGGDVIALEIADRPGKILMRSEEHTSELQSLMRISYAVFCLKKKQNPNTPSCEPQHFTNNY